MDNIKLNREKINEIDEGIVNLLADRFNIVVKIGRYKKSKSLPITDKKREREIIKDLSEKAKILNISSVCIKNIWTAIFKEAYIKEKYK